jgi:hypothetical protein
MLDKRGQEIKTGDTVACAFRDRCVAKLGLGRVLVVEPDRLQWSQDGNTRPSWIHYPERIVIVERQPIVA